MFFAKTLWVALQKNGFQLTTSLIGLCGVLTAAPSTVDKPVIINGLAAVISQRYLTIRDVYLFQAIENLKKGAAIWEEELSLRDLRQSTARYVVELAALEEMKALKYKPSVSFAEAEKLTQKARQKSSSQWNSLVTNFGMNAQALTQRVYESMQAKRFLAQRFETLLPKFSASEMARMGFRSESLTPEQQSALKKIEQQRGQSAFEQWLRSLREKYEVIDLLDG